MRATSAGGAVLAGSIPSQFQANSRPILFLVYLQWLKTFQADITEDVARFFRGKQAAEIRSFPRCQSGNTPVLADELTEEARYCLPHDDGPPSCSKEWFAVITVWRLTFAMKEISVPQCAAGSAGCRINPLPEPWKQKLDECLRITKPSANIPANKKTLSLNLRRCNIDSILPALNLDSNESGLLDSLIVDTWFQILVQRATPKTIYIPFDSLEPVGSHLQEVAERAVIVTSDIEMMLFPTIMPEHDHCVLLVAYPQTQLLAIYDPLTPNTTKIFAKDRAWVKRSLGQPALTEKKGSIWELKWVDCPLQRGEMVCGVFMLVNALFAIVDRDPDGCYSHMDVLFLRRYVAAVVCMVELPETMLAEKSEKL